MRKLVVLLKAFCVATVIAELVVMGMIMSKKLLTAEKIERAMAIVYEMDDLLVDPGDEPEEWVAPDQTQLARTWAMKASDMQNRDKAIGVGMDELLLRKQKFETDVSRFKNVKLTFDTELNRKIEAARTKSLREVGQVLQALPPKLAKDQILLALGDQKLAEMGKIINAMPIAKSRKILQQFKSPADREARFEILKEIGRVPTSQKPPAGKKKGQATRP